MLAAICSLSTFQPRFRDPYLRPVRAVTFGSLAIFTMVPVLHGLYKLWVEYTKSADGRCVGCSNTRIEHHGCHGLCFQG